jgi:hypothetical protein
MYTYTVGSLFAQGVKLQSAVLTQGFYKVTSPDQSPDHHHGVLHEQRTVVQAHYCYLEESAVAMLHCRAAEMIQRSMIHVLYLSIACLLQKATLSSYFARSSLTPLPPSSLPSAFLSIVMGCIGISLSVSCALMPTTPQGASEPLSFLLHARANTTSSYRSAHRSKYLQISMLKSYSVSVLA